MAENRLLFTLMYYYVGLMPLLVLSLFIGGVLTIERKYTTAVFSVLFYALFMAMLIFYGLWGLAWFDLSLFGIEISLNRVARSPAPVIFMIAAIAVAGLAARFQGGKSPAAPSLFGAGAIAVHIFSFAALMSI